MIPPPAHLPIAASVLRRNAFGQAHRITEDAPPFDGSPESILAIVSWLAVENHARWAPKPGATYCNVYAHDLVHLLGAYLPRVWWLPKALLEIEAGKRPSVVYANTVGELSANALYRWLDKWSHLYGWRRVATLDEAQSAANRGRAVVICGRNKVEANPGHISCVLPESDRQRARRELGDRVFLPVQSQAGGRCYEVSLLPGTWWTSATFAEFGFWVHDPAAIDDSPTIPETLVSRSSTKVVAVREPIADLSLTSPATPLRGGDAEYTPAHLRDGEPPDAA